jgi:hypothetical protein
MVDVTSRIAARIRALRERSDLSLDARNPVTSGAIFLRPTSPRPSESSK